MLLAPQDSNHIPEIDALLLDEIELDLEASEILEGPITASPYPPTQIILEAAAWEQINQHLRENLRQESGGLLLGEIYQTEGGHVIRIRQALPARSSVNTAASVDFTIESWQALDTARAEQAPGEKLVGWYHSHPKLSAFFSQTDHFTHQHYFSQPWHVGLVVDPVSEDYVFYRWEGGQVVEAPSFLLEVDRRPPPPQGLMTALIRNLSHSLAALPDSAPHLAQELARLQDRLAAYSVETPLPSLLRLLLELQALPPQALAEAQALSLSQVSEASTLDIGQMFLYSPAAPDLKRAILQQGWFLQYHSQDHLRLRNMQSALDFEYEIRIKTPLRDMSLGRDGTAYLLSDDPAAPLLMLSPRLPLFERELLLRQKVELKLHKLKLDWGGHAQPEAAHRLLAGNQGLYLLAEARLYYFSPGEGPGDYRCTESYPPSAAGWPHFRLNDWALDAAGRLLLLHESGGVAVWDRLGQGWQTRPAPGPDEPKGRFICGAWSRISLLGENSRGEARLWHLNPALDTLAEQALIVPDAGLRPQGLYSDGAEGLFILTPLGLLAAD